MMRKLAAGAVVMLVLAFAGISTASPADDEAVLAGYRKLYSGDVEAARGDFERLLAARPADLPARFGMLNVLEQRVRENRGEAPGFERALDALISDAEARYDRAASDSEALFYIANGYMMRARYRVNYDKGMWGAARDGAKAKRHAEAYIKRYPGHGDAYFALGTYNYYVELAPAFARVLRFLMFLPSGNRTEGLKQIERAYREGSLFSPLAGLILIEVYSQFETRPAHGIRIGEQLAAKFPGNPTIQFSLAELYLSPAVEDPVRAGEQYAAVIDTEDRRAGSARPARYQARLGLASARFEQWKVNDAIAGLTETIDALPAQPDWVMPNFLLRRGNYRALVDDPRSVEDAQRVLNDARWQRWHKSATDQLAWIGRRRASGEAAVYAALIAPNRLVFDRRWNEAAAAYEVVRARHGSHPQVRYRIAQMRFKQHDLRGLEREFADIAEQARKSQSTWLTAQALLHQARVHDLTGRRDEAKRTYARVVDDYERESASWPAKVGLVTAYQRR